VHVQLFTQAVRIITFFDCKADLVGQQSSDGYRITHPVSKISGYAGDINYTEDININLSLNYTIFLFHNS